jgi:hypothetical protein
MEVDTGDTGALLILWSVPDHKRHVRRVDLPAMPRGEVKRRFDQQPRRGFAAPTPRHLRVLSLRMMSTPRDLVEEMPCAAMRW